MPPPEGRISCISALRRLIFSTTTPANSSSTSTTTSSIGSSRWPVAGSVVNNTRGREIDSSKPFAPHRLDQHAELQFAAAGDLERILLGALADPDRDIALGFAEQALADHARGHLGALAAGERAVVDREGDRQGRRVDRVGGERRRDLGGADRVGDRRLSEPGDGDDVARPGLLDRPPLEPAIGLQFGQPRLLDHPAVAAQRFDRHVEARHPGMNEAGQHPAEIGVVIERRRQHRERRVGIGLRRRHMRQDQLEKRRQILARRIEIGRRPAVAAGGENRREIELRLGRVERREQIEDLVVDRLSAGVGPIDLVDHDDRLQTLAQRLADDEFGLRHRAFGGVDQHQNPVDHAEDALDLAAEIGVAGRVDDVDPHVPPDDRGAFGEDRDAALALELVRIEGALGDLLVGAERAALAQHRIDQGRLAMVDMGDDRDVANVH